DATDLDRGVLDLGEAAGDLDGAVTVRDVDDVVPADPLGAFGERAEARYRLTPVLADHGDIAHVEFVAVDEFARRLELLEDRRVGGIQSLLAPLPPGGLGCLVRVDEDHVAHAVSASCRGQ